MSPNTIRSAKIESPLARKKRRAFIMWATIVSTVILIATAGAAYWILFSPAFAIETTIIEGTEGHTREGVNALISVMLEKQLAGFIKTGRNMLLFDGDGLTKKILTELPEIRDVKIEKDLPHTLRIIVAPRISLGVWCRNSKCARFDETGFVYGSAIPSFGTLFLMVQDQRTEDGALLDNIYFEPIKSAYELIKQGGVPIRDIVIPAGGINEIVVNTTSGYAVKIAIDTEISAQVRALLAFLAQKRQEDPAFAPVYVDLRIPDRIYYK